MSYNEAECYKDYDDCGHKHDDFDRDYDKGCERPRPCKCPTVNYKPKYHCEMECKCVFKRHFHEPEMKRTRCFDNRCRPCRPCCYDCKCGCMCKDHCNCECHCTHCKPCKCECC